MPTFIRSFSFVSLLSFFFLACGPVDETVAGDGAGAEPDHSLASPVVGGVADAKDPAVIAIDIGGEALCSGTLIGPRTVLTARHCVSVTAEHVSCPSSSVQVYEDRDPASLTVLVGEHASSATPVARGASLIVPDADRLCGEDIAILELDRDVTGIKPLATGSLDTVTRIRAVGFGKRSDGGPAGEKRTRSHIPVVARSASEFLVTESICSGDSGGPAIDEASGRVVGVVSRGGPGCEGPDVRDTYTRVDAFHALISEALAHKPTSPGLPGAMKSCGLGHHCPAGMHCDHATMTCATTEK